MRIHDARPLVGELSLDREGYVLVPHASTVSASRDMAELDRTYHQEVGELIQALSGADRVLPQRTGLLLRYGERSEVQSWARPARFAHLDYTASSAKDFVGWVEGWERQPPRPYGRFAIYQTWRAISDPPQDTPLAVCDGRSVADAETVTFDAVIGPETEPGQIFESRVVRPGPHHLWRYFPNMRADELLVFKAFDSADARQLNVVHTAFDDPTAPADCVPRASLEARFFAFFD